MSDMIERIARALAELSPRETFHYTYDQNPGEYEEIAIAAVRAMREPTYEMKFSDKMGDLGFWPEQARDVWYAMIDSILSQPQEEKVK